MVSLEKKVMEQMKAAMKAKDSVALGSLRSIKNELLKVKTASANAEDLSEAEELKLLQKLVKQRKESAQVYSEQGREDLAEPELNEAKIIEQFLPQQLTEAEIEEVVTSIIAQVNAESMKDMGLVMGLASKQLAGKADGKTISKVVKAKLS